jgi:hypothetical protein
MVREKEQSTSSSGLTFVRFILPAGELVTTPVLSATLGQIQINTMEFCKSFNQMSTETYEDGVYLNVDVYKKSDNTYFFVFRGISLPWLLYDNSDDFGNIPIEVMWDIYKIYLAGTQSPNFYSAKKFFCALRANNYNIIFLMDLYFDRHFFSSFMYIYVDYCMPKLNYFDTAYTLAKSGANTDSIIFSTSRSSVNFSEFRRLPIHENFLYSSKILSMRFQNFVTFRPRYQYDFPYFVIFSNICYSPSESKWLEPHFDSQKWLFYYFFYRFSDQASSKMFAFNYFSHLLWLLFLNWPTSPVFGLLKNLNLHVCRVVLIKEQFV